MSITAFCCRPVVFSRFFLLPMGMVCAFALPACGQTDSHDGEAHNQALSDRRMASVLAAVLSKRLALEGRIEAFGKGKGESLSQGINPRDHAPNRRVEVHAIYVSD